MANRGLVASWLDEGKFFAGDPDNAVWRGTLRSEFGADAEFFHDITEAVDRSVVGEIGTTGEFFDLFAGDLEGVIVEFCNGEGGFMS